MPEIVPVIDKDNATRGAPGGYTGGTLSKTATYTITKADIDRAGGDLQIRLTAAQANDVILPKAYLVKGAKITIWKGQASTNAVAAQANAIDQIDAGTAGARFQNVTAEFGCLELWAHDGSTSTAGIWRIRSFKGTWVAAS